MVIPILFLSCQNEFDLSGTESGNVYEELLASSTKSYPPWNVIQYKKKHEMDRVWHYTLQFAVYMREPRELGLVFYARPESDVTACDITISEIQSGPPMAYPDWSKDAEMEESWYGGSIELKYYDGNYCGFFHTHVPLTAIHSPKYYRDTGPSEGDIISALSTGAPEAVYDYVAPRIYGTHAENEPAKIYWYGEHQRRLIIN